LALLSKNYILHRWDASGFWVKLFDSGSGSETWLKDAKEFINYPVGE